MSFANSTKIKRMLGIPSTITYQDDAIADVVTVVDAMVLEEIGLDAVTSTSYTEKIDVTAAGMAAFCLTYRPVLTITSLSISGSAKTETTDYKVDKNTGFVKLVPLSALLPTGRDVIEVTYTAGFDSAPADLQYAANLIACSMLNIQSHAGISREKTSTYAVTIDNDIGATIPNMARRILAKYRRVFARGMNPV